MSLSWCFDAASAASCLLTLAAVLSWDEIDVGSDAVVVAAAVRLVILVNCVFAF